MKHLGKVILASLCSLTLLYSGSSEAENESNVGCNGCSASEMTAVAAYVYNSSGQQVTSVHVLDIMQNNILRFSFVKTPNRDPSLPDDLRVLRHEPTLEMRQLHTQLVNHYQENDSIQNVSSGEFNTAVDVLNNGNDRVFDEWFRENREVWGLWYISLAGGAVNDVLAGIRVRIYFDNGSSIVVEYPNIRTRADEGFVIADRTSARDADGNFIPISGDDYPNRRFYFDSDTTLQEFVSRLESFGGTWRGTPSVSIVDCTETNGNVTCDDSNAPPTYEEQY